MRANYLYDVTMRKTLSYLAHGRLHHDPVFVEIIKAFKPQAHNNASATHENGPMPRDAYL